MLSGKVAIANAADVEEDAGTGIYVSTLSMSKT
jgi:hypothetical protein